MTKEYQYIIKQIDAMETKEEKILFILRYLASHNKNLTKTQDWLIEDLLELVKK